MKVNVIGLGYIGLPTALTMAAAGIDVVGTDYNQEFCGEKIIKFKNKNFKFQIFDLRGRNINYIEGFSLVFLVYNVDKLTIFNNIPKYIEKNIENIKMVLCGNKNNCGKRKVEKKEGEKLAKKKYAFF